VFQPQSPATDNERRQDRFSININLLSRIRILPVSQLQA